LGTSERLNDSGESLESLVDKNVAAIARIEEGVRNERTRAHVAIDGIADFCGSLAFLYSQVAIFTGWLLWNSLNLVSNGLKFDPPPFNKLTLIVAMEAIFLSIFILISQKRQQKTAEQQSHLDLQINMLAEQESSQMLLMMKQLMDHLGLDVHESSGEVLEQATDPERVAKQIAKSQEVSNVGVTDPKPSEEGMP
jgi:uncharacterized membrane protein